MHTKRPPRLRGFDYTGFYRYFLTICTYERHTAFVDLTTARTIADHFLQWAAAHGFAVIAYCVMNDHLHALVHGTRPDANFRDFVHSWKQKTGFEWKRRTRQRLWQEGYYERVLRDEDADLWVVSYIATNPMRAGLCETPDAYPLFGSSKYSVAEILTALKELEPWKP